MGGKRREGEGQGGKWERGSRDARQEQGDRRAAAGKAGATAEKEGPEGAPKRPTKGGRTWSSAEEGGWAKTRFGSYGLGEAQERGDGLTLIHVSM